MQLPCTVPEEVPRCGQQMRFGKFSAILAFHVGDT